MDAFGKLQTKIFQNPEEELGDSEENPHSILSQGADVAQKAFDRSPPTNEDVYDHMLADTLVLAYVNDELVGFSGTDFLEDENIVLGSGLAVHPDYQEQGIGSVIRTRGIMQDLVNRADRPENPFLRDRGLSEGRVPQGYFAARSANPGILSHMQSQYGAFPREDEEMPADVEDAMERAAAVLDPDLEFNPPVVVEAYPSQMNDMPEHELSDYLERVMDEKGSGYDSGDALIIAARLEGLEETYAELVGDRPYEVSEKVI